MVCPVDALSAAVKADVHTFSNLTSSLQHDYLEYILKHADDADDVMDLNKWMAQVGGASVDLEKFDFGAHLKRFAGDAPTWMHDPHAHHILFKKGLGKKQQRLVDEGQALLRKYDIDPITGPENLAWAPNRVTGQHGMPALSLVLEKLKDADRLGTREAMVDASRELGEIAAKR